MVRSGAALLLLRHLHRPFSEIEGLLTVLLCIPCLEVRLAQPDTLLGLHDPGQPWEKWGCPIEGCGRWFQQTRSPSTGYSRADLNALLRRLAEKDGLTTAA